MPRLLPYEIYYENSEGERLALSEPPFLVTGGQLFDTKWQLTTVKRPAGEGIRLLRARHSPEERTMNVRAAARSPRQLSELLRRMGDVFDRDIDTLSPGKLWINGRYMRCWCSARQKELSCDFTASASVVVSVLPQAAVWCREHHYILTSGNETAEKNTADHFYTAGTNVMTVRNNTVQKCPMRIVFTGPAVNPSVCINEEQTIGINVTVNDGEQAVIDQTEHTVYTINSDGEKTNCFNARLKNGMTFSPLPVGESTVLCTSAPQVEVTVIEQRSEPEWTLN